jgi:hypothetical protein
MWAETLIQRRAAGIRQQNHSAAADGAAMGGAVGGSPYRERDTTGRPDAMAPKQAVKQDED